MIENYLDVLEESLKQKSEILDEVARYSGRQEELLKQESMSLEEFDACVDKKDELIQKLSRMDEGFETLYERIKEQLAQGREAYRDRIARLQQLIREVTAKSVSIQAQEARNKEALQRYFTNERSRMRTGRMASKAAYDYYKNMSNTEALPPQFLDSKQ